MRVRQADWQPEHLVVHGVGVVDLVSVGGAPRSEVVVLVGAGAGALLDEEEQPAVPSLSLADACSCV